jgi:fumarate reductase flavoprotein subunit
MELPPGWRGYGAKDYTDHPDTLARQAEVDTTKQRIGDRFERQRALMAYEHLLPPPLRGRNERIDEGLPPAGPEAAESGEPSGFVWESE